MRAVSIASGPQHMVALERANRVRLARAALKRRIASGEVDVAQTVLTSPWEAESMSVSVGMEASENAVSR